MSDHLPDDFKKRMRETLGDEEYGVFLASYEMEPLRSMRMNPLKKRRAGGGGPDLKDQFSLKPVPWCVNGFYYGDSHPGKHPLHEAGVWYIQEASAMAPPLFMDLKPGLRVLDLCASPGGKSTEIAALMEGRGFLLSNEIIRDRALVLSLNIERMGIKNTLVTNETPERLSACFEGFFDRILVDAPCSGEGMFRKDPKAADEWSTDNVRMCAERQRMILGEAVKMLSPGGLLVYSTCTFSREEDEETASSFLNENEDIFVLDPESLKRIPEGFEKTEIVCDDPSRGGCGIRIWPHKAGGEGHFFAVFKRTGDIGSNRVRSAGSGALIPAADKEVRMFNDLRNEAFPDLSLPEGICHRFGDQLYLAPEDMPGLSGLKVLRPGLHLGTLKKDRFIPSHSLALFLSPDEVRSFADLESEEDAYRFLKGETLPAEFLTDPAVKGWCLISYAGYSLGWGKSDGRLIKNHYPKGLRVS